ncbi:MAG: response regulator, partial [Dehalococcoidia bacterium]
MEPKTKLLIVDDSLSVRCALERGLAGDSAIDVVGVARDGVEALELLPRLTTGVITLDNQMPRRDGLEALRQIMVTRPTPV